MEAGVPPRTRIFPEGRVMRLAPKRCCFRLAVRSHRATVVGGVHAGAFCTATVKTWDAEKPLALVTVAVTVAFPPVGAQVGAFQDTSLEVKLDVGVASVPLLEAQLKVRALLLPSSARTRNVTVLSPTTEALLWCARTMRGGMFAVAPSPTQMRRVPWVWPPFESFTVTVSAQLPHVSPAGTAVGVKEAMLEVPSVQVPAQDAAHW